MVLIEVFKYFILLMWFVIKWFFSLLFVCNEVLRLIYIFDSWFRVLCCKVLGDTIVKNFWGKMFIIVR